MTFPRCAVIGFVLWLPASVPIAALSAATFYVATDGNDKNAGTIDQPFATIQHAQTQVVPGDTVFIRGGVYRMQESQIARTRRIFAHVIRLDKSGVEGKPIKYCSYQDERPIFDFSEVKPHRKRVHAFSVSASWIHLKGFEIVGVQVTIPSHTQSICVANDGSHNVFERLSMHDGMGIGFYGLWGRHNLIVNCDAYRNHDSYSENGRGGNTDGFGYHPKPGAEGNVFRGCRAWLNSDDGFDCIHASESVTFESCWAFLNGYSIRRERLADGNGFKAGGYGSLSVGQLPRPIPRHLVKDCVAVRNKNSGFYSNHHVGGSDWINNVAFHNGINFNMLNRSPDNSRDVPGYDHFLKGNVSIGSRRSIINLDFDRSERIDNQWEPNAVSVSPWVHLTETRLSDPRGLDGSLPELWPMTVKVPADN